MKTKGWRRHDAMKSRLAETEKKAVMRGHGHGGTNLMGRNGICCCGAAEREDDVMANYTGMTRTNYFKVTDADKFKELTYGLSAECDIEVEVNGNTCWIGCYSPLDYSDGEEYDMDSFYEQLSKLIVDGDAAIFIEVGNEKLRYLVGTSVIVTSKGVDWIDLGQSAVSRAKEMLGDEKWKTKMEH